MKNEKGPIADTYHSLQALPALERASKSYAVEKHSIWSSVKAILQSTEIGIQNLNDLFSRLIADLDANAIGQALIKLGWIKALNFLLIKVSNLNNLIGNELVDENLRVSARIESKEKLEGLYKQFDDSIAGFLKRNAIDLPTVLKTEDLSNVLYKFLHDYRIIAYESTLWAKNANNYFTPANTNYSDFIGRNEITLAVNEPKLTGDTFFTQFRCLHQIPELLTAEVNDQIEFAMLNFRIFKNDKAHKHLKTACDLFSVTVDSIKPIVDNLSQNDYHQYRKYLGLTSGSHSVSIHFHLFRDLYPAMAKEYLAKYFKDEKKYKFELQNNYLIKLLETELFRLRNLIAQWRDFHLNLPRINLGENKTKSLIGSSEAVETVKRMRDAAHEKDPLNQIINVYFRNDESHVQSHFETIKSFDTILGQMLGTVTQDRFPDVQGREGNFSVPSIFKNPPKRKI